DYLENINKATAEDVRKMAEKYLTDDNLSVGWFIPSGPAGASTPAPAKKSKLWTFAPHELAFYRDPEVKQPVKKAIPVSAKKPPAPTVDPSKLFVNRTLRTVGPNGEILLAL